MPEDSRSAVTTAESYKIVCKRVMEFVLTESPDYPLADYSNGPTKPREGDSFVLIRYQKRGFLERLSDIWGRDAYKYAAFVWIQNDARKAGHKRWVIEVYGRQHLINMKRLAEKLAQKFSVEVHVRLESEDEKRTWVDS